MSRLSERLSRLRESGMAPRGEHPEKENPVRLERNPGSATRAAAVPGTGWYRVDDYLWERKQHHPRIFGNSSLSDFVVPEGISIDQLVFYDLETTGLSGGAGNIAFLIGLGREVNHGFEVLQLFLADYPGETAMLERYKEFVSDAAAHVSYNGRSFDSQVLKTRFLLNRLIAPEYRQIDLLYPSRRLWKGRLENLSLKTIEADILDFHRIDDLPGSEAPDAWFEWLDGRGERIEAVFRHNDDDIVSLARLLRRLEEWGRHDPERKADPPAGCSPNPRGMARQWFGRNPSMAERWLRAGWGTLDVACGRELAWRAKRAEAYGEAAAIWEKIRRIHPGDFSSSVELAKYWEHKKKNSRRAFGILESIGEDSLSIRQKEALEHRRRRLLRC